MTTTARVTSNLKVVTLPFSGVTVDAMLTDAKGNFEFDLSSINWQRIVGFIQVDALTGTNVIFKGVTGADPATPLNIASVGALGGDGTTAFNSATITAAGTYSFACTKKAGDGSKASNIGAKLGIFADVTAITVLSGKLVLFIDGQ